MENRLRNLTILSKIGPSYLFVSFLKYSLVIVNELHHFEPCLGDTERTDTIFFLINLYALCHPKKLFR